MRSSKRRRYALRHTFIVFVSLGSAIFLAKSGFMDTVFGHLNGYGRIGSFVAGFFFTSGITVAPAIVALGTLAQDTTALTVALWGAAGAVIGDYLLLMLIRREATEVRSLLDPASAKRERHIFKNRVVKLLSPFLGALLIASPLPDELGLALLGVSRAGPLVVVPISFIFNFLGVLAIASIAQSL